MIIPFSPTLHFLFESLAYLVGGHYYARLLKKDSHPDKESSAFGWVAVGAILGAVIGSKLVFWLHCPDLLMTRLADPRQLMGGKTVLGGFLGGVIGVEFAKKRCGITAATGDIFVLPIMVGLMVGRIGCFLGGLSDGTHGLPSPLPWAVDFGDGIPRHPTQLYELVLVALLFPVISLVRSRVPQAGDAFKLFMFAYLVWRLLGGFLKPRDVLYFHALSGIQLASLAGLVYYFPHFLRIGVGICRAK